MKNDIVSSIGSKRAVLQSPNSSSVQSRVSPAEKALYGLVLQRSVLDLSSILTPSSLPQADVADHSHIPIWTLFNATGSTIKEFIMMIRMSHRVLTEGAPKGHLQFLGLGRRKNKVATPKFATFMGDFLHSISNFCENRIS